MQRKMNQQFLHASSDPMSAESSPVGNEAADIPWNAADAIPEELSPATHAALDKYMIRPQELRELVIMFSRLGPGCDFPGFHPGREEETVMLLSAVRAKLHDLSRMHDSERADAD